MYTTKELCVRICYLFYLSNLSHILERKEIEVRTENLNSFFFIFSPKFNFSFSKLKIIFKNDKKSLNYYNYIVQRRSTECHSGTGCFMLKQIFNEIPRYLPKKAVRFSVQSVDIC